MPEPAPDRRLRFKAFYSHAYDADRLNVEFFKILHDVADVQFEVDIGLKNLNVTRLEHRLRDCDAFVGVYPFPKEQNYEPSAAETMQESRYFRLEMELAARAGRPGIIFYDKRFETAIRSLNGFKEYAFQARNVHSAVTNRYRSEIASSFGEFCRRLQGEIDGRATGFEGTRRRKGVGLLVPKGRGGYSKQAIAAITRAAIGDRGTELVEIGWPPVVDARLFDQLDSLDWMLVDVGPATSATGILGVIHGRFIPAVRMRRGVGPPEPEQWVNNPRVGGLFGAVDVGYRKDIVYWQSVDSLETQLRGRVKVALKPPGDNEIIRSEEEAIRYFHLATKNRSVFLSYAGNDRRVAEKMASVLRANLPTVFDYRDQGESLPPGTRWREKIKTAISEAHFGVLLVSRAYLDSGYCEWESGLLVDAHLERKVPLIPVVLDVRARDVPTGLEHLQAERFSRDETPEAVAERLVVRLRELDT